MQSKSVLNFIRGPRCFVSIVNLLALWASTCAEIESLDSFQGLKIEATVQARERAAPNRQQDFAAAGESH